MKQRQLLEHPQFPMKDRAQQIRTLWEVTLSAGESTTPQALQDGEKVYYILSGKGSVTIGDDTQPITTSQLAYVPPGVASALTNPFGKRLRVLVAETLLPPLPVAAPVEDRERQTLANVEQLESDLPEQIDEATAIQAIVKLFDIGGKLSQQIEDALGLDNEDGVKALVMVEKKVMEVVVEIANRYGEKGEVEDDGGFPPRKRI